ncbi:hypothetical protein [Conexibacter woesei]|uniref:hypothetical protein n=1 Tax=Conexibacter woesei TaxID=191495 RepID=UPI0012DD9CD1|nr:hypothetical protein [Conexibacter woesei]
MDDDRIEALLAEGIATDDPERRCEIASELTQGDPQVAFPLAVRMLRSREEGGVALGGELIESTPKGRFVERDDGTGYLVEDGPTFDDAQRAVLIGLVAERMAAAGEPAAVALLRASWRLVDAALLGPVLALAGHPSAEVRHMVAVTLPGFAVEFEDAPAIDATLLALARDEDDDVVDWAIFGLGLNHGDGPLDTPEARALFAANVDHEHVGVRDEARVALALLGDVGYLEDCLYAEDEDDARRTHDAFVTAAGRTGDPRLHASLVTLRDLGYASNPFLEAELAAALEATRPAT